MARKRIQQLPEQLADQTFPSLGLDLTAEFELQRQGTTPAGQNVRTYETITQRGRGGSRPGLAQYIPQQVNGFNLIQHLNYIVDPQGPALATTFDPLDTPIVPLGLGWGFGPGPWPNYGFPTIVDATPNPAIKPQQGGVQMPNGFWTRTGGSGLQPNKNFGTVKISPPPPPPPPPPPGAGTLQLTANSFGKPFGVEFIPNSPTVTQVNNGGIIQPISGYFTASVVGGSDPGGWAVTSVVLASDGFPNSAADGSYPIHVSDAQGTGLGQFLNITYVDGTLTVFL